MLLNSKLPIDVLGRVWELADIDKDGMLDSDEFAVVRKEVLYVMSYWKIDTPVPTVYSGKAEYAYMYHTRDLHHKP